MISNQDKALISELWSSFFDFCSDGDLPSARTMLGQLEDAFDNIKGIRSDINSALKIKLRDIRDGLSSKDIEKALDAFDGLTTQLQVNLYIKLDPHYVNRRSFENFLKRGFDC